MDISVLFCSNRRFILCKQGEFGQELSYHYQPWIDQFGEGEIGWLIKRPNDESAYPLVSVEENGVSTITLTETESQYDGDGELEVYYVTDENKRISNTLPFYIMPSLQNIGDVPAPWQSYVDKVREDARQAKISNIINADYVVNSYVPTDNGTKVLSFFNHGYNACAITGWALEPNPRLDISYRGSFEDERVVKMKRCLLSTKDPEFASELRLDTPNITVTEHLDNARAYRGVMRNATIGSEPITVRVYVCGYDKDDNVVDEFYSAQMRFELVDGELAYAVQPYVDTENALHITGTYLIEADSVGDLDFISATRRLSLVSNILASTDYHDMEWFTEVPNDNLSNHAYGIAQEINASSDSYSARTIKGIVPNFSEGVK